MSNGLSTRHEIETRAAPQAPQLRGRTAFGYAAIFNSESRDLGGFTEMIDRGAFSKSESDGFPCVLARWEHRDILGTVASGTARIRTDDKGLPFEIDLPRSRDDVLELIERRDVTGASFEFQAYSDRWENGRSMPVRHLESARLIDISIVSNPAYLSAHTSVRSALQSFSEWVEAPYEEVIDSYEKRELARYYRRSDMKLPSPLDNMPQRINQPDDGVTGEAAQAWLESHKPSGMDGQQAWLQIRKRRIDFEAADIERLERSRQQYQPYGPGPDDAARQQQAELLAIGTQRRIQALAREGIEVPETSCGATHTHHGPAQPGARTPRERGWLSS